MKKRCLLFTWESTLYSLPLDEVIEVVDLEDMVKTNLMELKLTNYKNRTLPVLDPISVFSIDESKITNRSKIIVTEKRNLKFGFLVDDIFGVETIEMENTRKAGVNERRFITRIINNNNIVEMAHFIDERIADLFVKSYSVKVTEILDGERLYNNTSDGREFALNDLRMESLNFLIEANRKKMDEKHIEGLCRIQEKIERI